MVPNGPKRSKIMKKGHNGEKLSKGPNWSKMVKKAKIVKNCQKLSKMVQNDPNGHEWSWMILNDLKWSKMVRINKNGRGWKEGTQEKDLFLLSIYES